MGAKAKLVAPPAALIAAILVAIVGPKVGGVQTTQVAAYLAAAIAALLAAKHAPKIKKAAKRVVRRRPPSEVTVWDAVTITNVPRGIRCFLAYVDGRFVNFSEARARFRKAKILTIATSAAYALAHVVDYIDVENGDITPPQVPEILRAQHRMGNKNPGAYANGSTWPQVRTEIIAAGLPLDQVRKIIADPTGKPHIPPGYDGCQYDWTPGFDKSLFHASAVS